MASASLPTILSGYIDRTGRVVIPLQYQEAHPFSHGVASVKKGNRWQIIDHTGRTIALLDANYSPVYSYAEGLAPAAVGTDRYGNGGKWGYIDKTGRAMITDYGIAFGFSEGLAMVQVNDKWGFIDHSGKLVIPTRYGSAADFAAGAAIVSTENDTFFIDPTGRRLDGKPQVFADPAKDDTEEFGRGRDAGDFARLIAFARS